MKKTGTVFLSCLFLLLFASSVFARGGTYIALRGGGSFLSSTDYMGGTLDFDTGYDASIAIGYNYIPGRVEVELGSRSNSFSCGVGNSCEDTAISRMVSTYAEFYDQHIGGMNISTYFGGGLGMSRVAFNLLGGDNTDLVFAYQITFGVGHPLSDTMTLDVGYRYYSTEDPKFQNGTVSIQNQGSSIFLGLRLEI